MLGVLGPDIRINPRHWVILRGLFLQEAPHLSGDGSDLLALGVKGSLPRCSRPKAPEPSRNGGHLWRVALP